MKILIVVVFTVFAVFQISRQVSGQIPGQVGSSPTPSSDDQPSEFLPDVSESEEDQLETGVINSQIAAEELHKTGKYWSPPDFSKQDDALGWTPHAFDVPPGFKRRVNFWIDIYTKYTTHQALLH